jgi:hypothetical protein
MPNDADYGTDTISESKVLTINEYLRQGRKIEAIRVLHEATDLSISVCKDVIEHYIGRQVLVPGPTDLAATINRYLAISISFQPPRPTSRPVRPALSPSETATNAIDEITAMLGEFVDEAAAILKTDEIRGAAIYAWTFTTIAAEIVGTYRSSNYNEAKVVAWLKERDYPGGTDKFLKKVLTSLTTLPCDDRATQKPFNEAMQRILETLEASQPSAHQTNVVQFNRKSH